MSAWGLVAIVVLAGTAGDLLSTIGMKHHGEIEQFGMRDLVLEFREMGHNPYLLISVPLLAISFFALMALLSVSEVSFAVPATASSYLIKVLLARLMLREEVSHTRWIGAALVTVGIALLSR